MAFVVKFTDFTVPEFANKVRFFTPYSLVLYLSPRRYVQVDAVNASGKPHISNLSEERVQLLSELAFFSIQPLVLTTSGYLIFSSENGANVTTYTRPLAGLEVVHVQRRIIFPHMKPSYCAKARSF